ncbi:3-hydroxybutyryl-CoA dehydrogenase OS=Lysinibacillus sphaericus OX=1421 GN=LS41612_16980 PE=4 SV=1 [Lysinibacillus sphaericus]
MDFIIENVDENIKTKEIVYRNLEKVCKQKCIYMVNTSCIPITLIGSYTDRAEKVIGVHFMNPVPMKNFAEVIQGWKTSEETVQHVRELLNKAGMEIEVIKDSAGFVSNRLSHLFMNEAAALVYEGVATAEQIDNIFKNAFGHKMGPLETADLIGVDTVLDSLKVLYTHYEDPKFRACPLLKQMVYAGSTGRKSGKGFYSY